MTTFTLLIAETPVFKTFTGSIELPNRPPAAVSQTVSTNEDTPKSMHLNATDADNDPLTYSIESGPVAGGTLTGFNPNTGDVTYNPPLNFNDGGVGNEDQFTFKVNDGTADSTVEMIHMLVNPVNDAPIANDDQFSITENSGPSRQVVGQNDTDVDFDSLCLVSVTEPAHGSVTTEQSCAPVILQYSADPGFVGTDTYNYTITDGGTPPLSDTGQVTVNVDDITPPTSPVLLYPPHGGSIKDNTPTFDWENSNDSSPVTYSLTVTGPGSVDVISEPNLNTSEFTATTPLVDGDYDWRVTPRDSFGNGGSAGYSSVDNFGLDTVAPVSSNYLLTCKSNIHSK